MFEVESRTKQPAGDPVARFATDADLRTADRLRQRIEARYLPERDSGRPAAAVRPTQGKTGTH